MYIPNLDIPSFGYHLEGYLMTIQSIQESEYYYLDSGKT